MKPLSLNLSKMKKVAGDRHSSVFEHPNGHQIKVAHAPLSAIQRKQIEKMPLAQATESPDAPDVTVKNPKAPTANQTLSLYGNPDSKVQNFDKGGSPTSHTDPAPNPTDDNIGDGYYRDDSEASRDPASSKDQHYLDAINKPSDWQQKIGDTVSGAASSAGNAIGNALDWLVTPPKPMGMPEPAHASLPASQPSTMAVKHAAKKPMNRPLAATSGVSRNDPYGMEKNAADMTAGMQAQSEGEQQLAQEHAKADAAQAPIQENYQDKLKSISGAYQNNVGSLMTEDQNLRDDIMKGHLNPERYVQSMSTGSKIANTIGMIIGGIGAATTHGSNLAFDALQDHIKNDIDSQKFDLNRKDSLLSHNLSLMNNLKDATTLTELQLGDITNSAMKQKAAEAATPIALAQAKVIDGQWQQKKAELQHNLAISRALLQSSGNAETDFQNRNMFLRLNGKDDLAKSLEEKHIPGAGQASTPVSSEDRQAIQHYKSLDSLFSQAQDYLKHAGTLGAGWQNANKARGKEIMGQMELEMGQLESLNRFTHEEGARYHSMIPDLTGTHFTSQDQAKLEQLSQQLRDKQNAIYSGYGMGTPGHSARQPQAQGSKSGEITRITKDGRTAIFDKNKKFLRYE